MNFTRISFMRKVRLKTLIGNFIGIFSALVYMNGNKGKDDKKTHSPKVCAIGFILFCYNCYSHTY